MKTALITGASSGIGLELATFFAKDKHNLVLVARSEGKLKELATELQQKYGITVKVIAKDLSKTNAAQEVYDELKQQNIEIDFLVNNAGFGEFGFFHEIDWKKEEMMINLNITTLTHFTKLFVQDMVKRRYGKVMNVASTAAFQPGPLMAVYYATKSYVLSFSEAIANELQDKGVTITALCPGPTESGFQAAATLEESKLVKGKKMPTSLEVAEYGYKAMMNGDIVAIHGMMNWIMAQSIRFTPRKMATTIVRMMSEKASS
jgi:short-subunit dehydrogenase